MASSEKSTITNDNIEVDIAIIGAGIAGINTAYHLETSEPERNSYVILEARNAIGGTWDLFRYPGIRSDSDMHTFGFSWNPWRKENSIASGLEILEYLQDSIEKFGIDQKVKFNHTVLACDWSSTRSTWSLKVMVAGQGFKIFQARFIVMGTGYYDSEQPLEASIPGIQSFAGPVIRPQLWPKDFDYTNKSVVIIGSGATAITLLPSMADKASHVTMLQRSPTYVLPTPMIKSFTRLLRAVFPVAVASHVTRAYFIIRGYLFYYFCIFFPTAARQVLRKVTQKQLPQTIPYDPHFHPYYNPWSQRLCVCPDGDFYAALRSGKGSIVTDIISNIDKRNIHLVSGKTLHPDIIVAATGLKLRFAGGIKFYVDGKGIDVTRKFSWKGFMIQDLPNLTYVIGYVNASWTLRAEVTSTLLLRLLKLMRQKGVRTAVPRLPASVLVEEKPVFHLSSTYVEIGKKVFPRSSSGQWGRKANYLADILDAKFGDISTGLQLT